MTISTLIRAKRGATREAGRSIVTLALLVVLAACRGAPAVTPKPPAVRVPASLDPPGIDAWLASELKARNVIGASVVVMYEGAVVLAKGYGTGQLGTQTAIDADTPFALGSVSKQLTCAAAYLLVDDGKLRMDDRVAKYFPELVRAGDITLDDLGSHMAGYRDYYPLDYLDRRMTAPIKPDDLIAKYAGLPLDFEPRSRWSYSNTGFVVLARIVERVSGMTFAQFVEQRIFAKLGMTKSSIGKPPPGVATGHTAFLLGAAERTVQEADGWLLGAADAFASATDVAKWDLAFSTGTILSETSRRAMAAPHRTTDNRTHQYGCGLGVRVDRGEAVFQHTGAIEGFFAYNAFVPRTRSAVVLLTNDARTDLSDLHRTIMNLVLQRPTDIPIVQGPSAQDTARSLVHQLQRGVLDRGRLGDDLSGYWDDKRIAEAATRLGKLGEPVVTLVERHERGGMEVATLELAFPKQTLIATMFRAPSGKIHQFILSPP